MCACARVRALCSETHLGHTGCPPSPPRTHTAMPSRRCRAGSRGRADTGHSSRPATQVCTCSRRKRGMKMEQRRTINTPTTALRRTAAEPRIPAHLLLAKGSTLGCSITRYRAGTVAGFTSDVIFPIFEIFCAAKLWQRSAIRPQVSTQCTHLNPFLPVLPFLSFSPTAFFFFFKQ